MTQQANETVQASSTASRFVTVFCWIVGLAYLAVGVTGVLSSDTSSLPVNLIRAIGGVAILPPILQSIGAHIPFVTRGWVPVVFSLVLLPIILVMAGKKSPPDFSPSTSAQPPIAGPTLTASATTAQNRLPARNRFAEVPAGHTLRPVQDALNAGDVDGAIEQLSTRNAVGPDDRLMKASLIAAIQAASDEQLNRDPGTDYAERIETSWLAEVRDLPSTAPRDDAGLTKLRSQIAGMIVNIEDGKTLKLSKSQAASRQRLQNALSAKQRALYPSMRKRYARALDAKLFQKNIRVAATGVASRTLLLNGGVFSFNSSIENTQRTLSEAAASLRFNKVAYRWTTGRGETTTYNLNVPSDDAIVK